MAIFTEDNFYQNINGKFEINSYVGTPPKNIVFVIDLISRDFELSEDSKKLLSATKINIW